MRIRSQHSNRKLVDIAADVVETGRLTWAVTPSATTSVTSSGAANSAAHDPQTQHRVHIGKPSVHDWAILVELARTVAAQQP